MPTRSQSFTIAGRTATGLLALALVSSGSPVSAASVIVRKSGSASAALLAPAIAKLLADQAGEDAPRVLELSGDAPADSALIARETRAAKVLFAIGPDATEAAGEARGTPVISLGVPNPARVRTAGTYVSIYPRLDRVFALAKTRLKARTIGLLFSPAKNREVALAFMKAAEEQGLTLTPIPVGSSGDLTRELPKALASIDVLLLAIDPLIFDRESLAFVVEQAAAAHKPTLGFLEELPRLGVTLALVTSAAATAQAAVDASREPVLVGKRRVDVDHLTVIASRKGAGAMGLSPETLGATRLD
jgi:hypothetical protein